MSIKTLSRQKFSLNRLNSSNTVIPAFGGTIVTYNFTSNNSTAVFSGITLSGLAGGAGSGPGGGAGGTAGSYTITGTGYISGGVAGNVGTAGGSASNSRTGASIGTDTELVAIASAQGYSSFGAGGSGAQVNGFPITGYAGAFAGGGGGSGATDSGGAQPAGGAGGNAGIVIKYISAGTSYYQVINQSGGSGSFTFPNPTAYVKIWAIGKGGAGGTGGGGINVVGGSGGSGGIAYCEFK